MTVPGPDPIHGRATLLAAHLHELRHRLIVALAAVAVATGFCLFFADVALQQMITPLKAKPLALGPADTLLQWLKVAFVGGVALAMPVILYEAVAFLQPTLTLRERRRVFLLVSLGTLFFTGGLLFGALVALPVSINFLQTFGEEFARIHYRLGTYVSFVTTLLLALGLGFETPLVVYFLARIGIVDYPFLKRNIRWAFLGAAILAAVLTPTPDPWTMLVVMGPLFLLYLLGVLFARFA